MRPFSLKIKSNFEGEKSFLIIDIDHWFFSLKSFAFDPSGNSQDLKFSNLLDSSTSFDNLILN